MPRTTKIPIAYSAVLDDAPCPPDDSPAYLRVIAPLAAVWQALRWWWGLAFLVLCGVLALMLTDAAQVPNGTWLSSPDPTRFALAGVGLFILLSCYAFTADRYLRWRQRARHDAVYVLRRVGRMPLTSLVPRYARAYIPRRDADTGADADASARAAIHHAAHQHRLTSRGSLGVCIYGPLATGKTRLAVEVVRARLGEWTFMRWPREPGIPFDFERVRGRRVALWLDDIHTWATPAEGALLADLPRQFARVGARLIVVATCLTGAEETRACRHLGSLLKRLTPIRLARISPTEADQLVLALAKEGIVVGREEFDESTGTPGSLVLGVRHMRDAIFPGLSDSARRVLQMMKLLRLAHIYAYPEARLQSVAAEMFGVSPAAWPAAREELAASGFIRVHSSSAARARHLEPVANAFLEFSVPSHLGAHAQASDEWPWLLETLERAGDVAGLITLGTSLIEEDRGISSFAPYSPRNGKQLSVLSFRAALASCSLRTQPHLWARAHLALGLALTARAHLSLGLLRADFWRQALAAYESALHVFSVSDDAALWALTHRALADLHQQRGADALFAGNARLAEAQLRAAHEDLSCALSICDPELDPRTQEEMTQQLATIVEALDQVAE